jgi:hypothetical protein
MTGFVILTKKYVYAVFGLRVTIIFITRSNKFVHKRSSGAEQKVAPNGGLEPPTLRLRVSRSTD